MYKIGIDSVEIARIKESMKSAHFTARVFGARERKELEKKKFRAESVAACFAAKEAFSKALGTGISVFSLNEVETLHNENGKPYLVLSGKAKKAAGSLTFEMSITHTKDIATAVVIAWESGKGGCQNESCHK